MPNDAFESTDYEYLILSITGCAERESFEDMLTKNKGRFLYARRPPLQEALEGRFRVKKLRRSFYVKKRVLHRSTGDVP